MIKNHRNRSKDGRYDFDDLSLICKCGHSLGVHSGQNELKKRGCLNEDHHIDGATGEYCTCKNFQKN